MTMIEEEMIIIMKSMQTLSRTHHSFYDS